jgi:hypothetical protein
MNEWEPIKDYPGYFVSKNGEIKRIYTNGNEKILKPYYNRDGYQRVCLSKSNKKKNCSVARLVALSFIPNYKKMETVNHIDGDKNNNSVTNLEWMSSRENIYHALENGLHALKCRPVTVFSNKVNTYRSVREAAKATGLHHSSILPAIDSEKPVKGFIFKSATIPPESNDA